MKNPFKKQPEEPVNVENEPVWKITIFPSVTEDGKLQIHSNHDRISLENTYRVLSGLAEDYKRLVQEAAESAEL